MSDIGFGEPQHKLCLDHCRILTVTGVKEVISFDELSVLLVTECGQLTIEGEGLHISRLDLEHGEADLDGTVSGLFYTKAKERGGGLFRRFKD